MPPSNDADKKTAGTATRSGPGSNINSSISSSAGSSSLQATSSSSSNPGSLTDGGRKAATSKQPDGPSSAACWPNTPQGRLDFYNHVRSVYTQAGEGGMNQYVISFKPDGMVCMTKNANRGGGGQRRRKRRNRRRRGTRSMAGSYRGRGRGRGRGRSQSRGRGRGWSRGRARGRNRGRGGSRSTGKSRRSARSTRSRLSSRGSQLSTGSALSGRPLELIVHPKGALPPSGGASPSTKSGSPTTNQPASKQLAPQMATGNAGSGSMSPTSPAAASKENKK